MPDFEFDPYAEFLNHGNRVDLEIMGTGEDDDWYSWEASKPYDHQGLTSSLVKVYGEGIETKYFLVSWESIHPEDVGPEHA